MAKFVRFLQLHVKRKDPSTTANAGSVTDEDANAISVQVRRCTNPQSGLCVTHQETPGCAFTAPHTFFANLPPLCFSVWTSALPNYNSARASVANKSLLTFPKFRNSSGAYVSWREPSPRRFGPDQSPQLISLHSHSTFT